VLAKTVVEAREAMGIATWNGDPSAATPIAELVLEPTPAGGLPVAPGQKAPTMLEKGARALRHYLPFFGKKR
jgi:hypothetical protein